MLRLPRRSLQLSGVRPGLPRVHAGAESRCGLSLVSSSRQARAARAVAEVYANAQLYNPAEVTRAAQGQPGGRGAARGRKARSGAKRCAHPEPSRRRAAPCRAPPTGEVAFSVALGDACREWSLRLRSSRRGQAAPRGQTQAAVAVSNVAATRVVGGASGCCTPPHEELSESCRALQRRPPGPRHQRHRRLARHRAQRATAQALARGCEARPGSAVILTASMKDD